MNQGNQDNTSSSSGSTKSFDKSLNKNVNDLGLPANSWSSARNAISNSKTGDLGKLGNEPSNLACISAPYTIIGFIHLVADYWVVFSTDDTNSAIGILRESVCQYTKVVDEKDYLDLNKKCLGLKRTNLISGVARAKSTCVYEIYWDDKHLNISRIMPVTIDLPSDNVWTNPHSPVPLSSPQARTSM